MSVKTANFKKYRVSLGPSQEMKFLGPCGDRGDRCLPVSPALLTIPTN